MKPTILFDSEHLTDKQKADLKKGVIHFDFVSPFNQALTLFGKGIFEPIQLQICTAIDPDAEANKDDFADVIMNGKQIGLNPDNTVVRLDIIGNYRLTILKPKKNKKLVIGHY